jgi:hypothetical protein
VEPAHPNSLKHQRPERAIRSNFHKIFAKHLRPRDDDQLLAPGVPGPHDESMLIAKHVEQTEERWRLSRCDGDYLVED